MKTNKFIIAIYLFALCNLSHAQNKETNIESSFENQITYTNGKSTLYDELVEIVDVSPELELEGRKPLLLIHGWSFEGKPAPPGGGYWDNFKTFLLNDPELRANFKPYYVKYWSNAVSISEIAEQLRIKVEEAGLHEQKIAIIAHSMGGLVSRSYLSEQSFTKGPSLNKKCGFMVDELITLGSPHHGSPMANGPARNAAMKGTAKLLVPLLDAFVFKEINYNEVNRSDLRWDNYDNLMNETTYTNEKNTWLVGLNSNTDFDSKLICYSSSIVGKTKIPDEGNIEQQYELGAWLQQDGFGFINDGIVPVQSSSFDGHFVKKVRKFNNYNHADIIRGKVDEKELFDSIKVDLMEVVPLKLKTLSYDTKFYLKHSQYRAIDWQAPSTIEFVNIYFSSNNGQNYQLIAANIDAKLGTYNWLVPDINADNCLIKVCNSNFEDEYARILTPINIYHNKIVISRPDRNGYLLRTQTKTIEWFQEGIGNKIKISYSDPKNGIEKVIANEATTTLGNNSFIWNPDTSLAPTSEAIITIQLLNLNDQFGDSEIYTFYSEKFQVLGNPNFTLLSPETNPIDYLGVEGEQLGIESPFPIKWKAEGEIKFIGFYLCDQDKNILKLLINVSNTPAFQVERTTLIRVPEFYGDRFYLLAKAGYSRDSILFETYSEYSFRINIKTEITSPENNAENISIQPCFEVKKIDNASRYEFLLEDISNNNYWEYQSDSNWFCSPAIFENELTPGANYHLTGWAWIDTFKTFVDKVTFTAEQTIPREFSIINPSNSDSTQENNIDITWIRSIGASSYKVELYQNNKIIDSTELTQNTDTTVNFNLNAFEFYKDIEIIVIASNQFGKTSSSTSVIKKFRNGIDYYPTNEKTIFIKNYPNPFSTKTTFELKLNENMCNAQITLLDLSGKKLENIFTGALNNGTNKINWEPNINIEPGLYIYQLKIEKRIITGLLQLK